VKAPVSARRDKQLGKAEWSLKLINWLVDSYLMGDTFSNPDAAPLEEHITLTEFVSDSGRFAERAFKLPKLLKKNTNEPGPSDRGSNNLVDPASSHMLVSKIKPCKSKYKLLYGKTANSSLQQL
jgi:hypothetical protein